MQAAPGATAGVSPDESMEEEEEEEEFEEEEDDDWGSTSDDESDFLLLGDTSDPDLGTLDAALVDGPDTQRATCVHASQPPLQPPGADAAACAAPQVHHSRAGVAGDNARGAPAMR